MSHFNSSDGIFLQIRSVGCKLRPGKCAKFWQNFINFLPRSLLLVLETHTVPVMSKTGRFPLPILKESHSLKKKLCEELTKF